METLEAILKSPFTRGFTVFVYIITLYYLILSFFGLARKKVNNKYEPSKKFALIVAAHNEEMVVKDIVKSLKLLDYPKEMYDIFVIADNCTDNTASIARTAGAKVYERVDKSKRGKGYALEWMFNKIFDMKEHYDSVVVFDADNLVSKNFLNEMNNKLCEGYKVVQGYLDSKNPKDTWITGGYSIAFWTSNRMMQLSKNNIGLSNQLGGTGFCIDTSVLKELGWGATCLTEDLEFSCKLVLNGYKIGWAHDAIIYDEKPLTLAQSWYQRKRWMQGFADVAGRYFFKLMKSAIKKRSFTAFDCALYSVQPFVTVLIGLSVIINAMYFRIITMDLIKTGNYHPGSGQYLILGLGLFFQFVYTPLILFLERKLDIKILWYFILYPIYSITWLPISILGIIDKNKKEWSHTAHTRSIDIKELEKAN